MNSFEKTIVGVAKTDQALRKVEWIVGGVIFIGLATFFGIVAYKIHKTKKLADAAKAEVKKVEEKKG